MKSTKDTKYLILYDLSNILLPLNHKYIVIIFVFFPPVVSISMDWWTSVCFPLSGSQPWG